MEKEEISKIFDDFKNELSDRQKAIEWWNSLNQPQKDQLYLSWFGCKSTDKFPDEIEYMWRKETQQNQYHDTVVDDYSVTDLVETNKKFENDLREKVDFDMLNNLYTDLNNLSKIYEELSNIDWYLKQLYNLKLFVKLLSKSSSFAHKAHKELNKLMK